MGCRVSGDIGVAVGVGGVRGSAGDVEGHWGW